MSSDLKCTFSVEVESIFHYMQIVGLHFSGEAPEDIWAYVNVSPEIIEKLYTSSQAHLGVKIHALEEMVLEAGACHE